jgi:hypothetical protein
MMVWEFVHTWNTGTACPLIGTLAVGTLCVLLNSIKSTRNHTTFIDNQWNKYFAPFIFIQWPTFEITWINETWVTTRSKFQLPRLHSLQLSTYFVCPLPNGKITSLAYALPSPAPTSKYYFWWGLDSWPWFLFSLMLRCFPFCLLSFLSAMLTNLTERSPLLFSETYLPMKGSGIFFQSFLREQKIFPVNIRQIKNLFNVKIN